MSSHKAWFTNSWISSITWDHTTHNAQLFALSRLPAEWCLKKLLHFTNVHTRRLPLTPRALLSSSWSLVSKTHIRLASFPSVDVAPVVCADAQNWSGDNLQTFSALNNLHRVCFQPDVKRKKTLDPTPNLKCKSRKFPSAAGDEKWLITARPYEWETSE